MMKKKNRYQGILHRNSDERQESDSNSGFYDDHISDDTDDISQWDDPMRGMEEQYHGEDMESNDNWGDNNE